MRRVRLLLRLRWELLGILLLIGLVLLLVLEMGHRRASLENMLAKLKAESIGGHRHEEQKEGRPEEDVQNHNGEDKIDQTANDCNHPIAHKAAFSQHISFESKCDAVNSGSRREYAKGDADNASRIKTIFLVFIVVAD